MSYRAGLDKQKILETAIDIADKEGIDALTIAALAKKFSVRSPSLYNHINGLEELRNELSLYGLNELYQRLDRSVIGKQKGEAVHSMADAYLTFAESHPGLYRFTLTAPDPNDTSKLETGNNIIALISEVLRDYGLEEKAVIHAVRGLRSILHGFVTLEQIEAFKLPISIKESLHITINSFLNGLQETGYC
ncbi:TetR/AcrR family transcriptional regulator [Oceanobacillus piezotolerans]|uniref:TetR/AcrR family transcriptional regulator n=1 Tax=Oceanobacillus piezotolerans TaxID=2448030 RepID=A0A498DGI6_9BACI|nr:TetR/AcrR family transcriptional regulator [Oceanobacillus piezotolerans]RLL43752.1 TetR/AcrR family transcriptional regulator [Oceanobacillus piezotolerans]